MGFKLIAVAEVATEAHGKTRRRHEQARWAHTRGSVLPESLIGTVRRFPSPYPSATRRFSRGESDVQILEKTPGTGTLVRPPHVEAHAFRIVAARPNTACKDAPSEPDVRPLTSFERSSEKRPGSGRQAEASHYLFYLLASQGGTVGRACRGPVKPAVSVAASDLLPFFVEVSLRMHSGTPYIADSFARRPITSSTFMRRVTSSVMQRRGLRR